MQKLAEASSTVSLVQFDFAYKGELYGVLKYPNETSKSSVYKNQIKSSDGAEIDWELGATSFYQNSNMDVEIGDDLLYITRANGDVTKLEDDEYNFTKVLIPIFYTYNKYTGYSGDALVGYTYDLQVRYAGTNE